MEKISNQKVLEMGKYSYVIIRDQEGVIKSKYNNIQNSMKTMNRYLIRVFAYMNKLT